MKRTLNTTATIAICAIHMCSVAWGQTFETMNLHQEMKIEAISALNSTIAQTNKVSIVKCPDTPDGITQQDEVQTTHGITFDVKDDGDINFNIGETELMGDVMERVFFNGKSLMRCIDERIELAMKGNDAQTISNTVRGMVYNPLWGKKLAVIGDSLISSPSGQTYAHFIAQRNNMTLVHKGRSGEKLCLDRTNELGQVTNAACINSYTNDIPSDADFILCQIGANDLNFLDEDDDTDMTTSTFKGCWNLLIVGIKTHYPNAKVGFILANDWTENLGQKSENVIMSRDQYRGKMIQWQKMQCQKLNVPVFDPSEDTRMFPYHYVNYMTNGTTVTESHIDDSVLSWYDKTKRQIGTDAAEFRVNSWIFQSQYLRDTQHTTVSGNLYLSFYYEAWMKTTLICN